MTTVLSGTNRPGSRTLLFAVHYLQLLRRAGQDARLLDLADVAPDFFHRDMYDPARMHPELRALQEEFVLGADKLAIFVPEYNGSYPGVLKLFIDGLSVNEYPRNFRGKRVALIGVASGRAGNLRGMDHLADTIAHMGGWVLPNRLPLSGVDGLVDDSGKVTDAATQKALSDQVEQLIDA